MGLTGTTTFAVGDSGKKLWFRVHSTGGWGGWRSWTSGKIDSLFWNDCFLGNRLQYSDTDTLTYQFAYAVFRVTTDAAGCSSLSFTFSGDMNISGCEFAKTTSNVTSPSNIPSSWAPTSKSGKTFSVSNVAMLPNTTYYVWLKSNDSTTGHFAKGNCTISGSGTYGSPGEITANDCNFDEPMVINFAASTAGATYTLKVQVGTSPQVTLQTQTATGWYTWIPFLTTYGSSYPNQSSVPCVITVSTYFGGVLAGTKTKTVTISFTALQAGPSTSNAFSIAPQNEGVVSGMSGYIQGYSKIRAAFTAANVTLKYGATIAKWTVKFGTAAAVDVAADTAIQDSAAISVTTEVTCTVTDSRGFTASETFTATITLYQQPTLTANAFRCDSEGVADDAGTYLSVTVKALYADVAGQNTITVQEYSKLAAAQNYGQPVTVSGGSTTQTGTNKKYEKTGFLIPGFTDNIFDIKIEATDALGNVATVLSRIASQAWAIHFRNRGAGAALGKAAEYDSVLDVGTWDIYLRDSNGNIVSLKTLLGI